MEKNKFIKRLYPRLDYRFTIKDTTIAIKGIFAKEINIKPLVDLFENDKLYFFNHARVGLRIALSSLNLSKNANIGVMIYNCQTVFNSIKIAGFNPVFIDITDSFQMNLEDLEKKADKIDALIVTHLFGIPNDVIRIKNRIKKEIPIIEDCAHSFLGKSHGNLLGTVGDIGIFSFGKGKFPSIGEGGFSLVNNPEYCCYFDNYIKKLKKRTVFEEVKNILFSIILGFLHNPIVYKYFTINKLKSFDKKHDFAGKYSYNEKRVLKTNQYLFVNRIPQAITDVKLKKRIVEKIAKIIAERANYSLNPLYLNDDINLFMLPIKKEIFTKVKDHKLIQTFEFDMHFKKCIDWAIDYGYIIGTCMNAERIVNQYITFPIYRV